MNEASLVWSIQSQPAQLKLRLCCRGQSCSARHLVTMMARVAGGLPPLGRGSIDLQLHGDLPAAFGVGFDEPMGHHDHRLLNRLQTRDRAAHRFNRESPERTGAREFEIHFQAQRIVHHARAPWSLRDRAARRVGPTSDAGLRGNNDRHTRRAIPRNSAPRQSERPDRPASRTTGNRPPTPRPAARVTLLTILTVRPAAFPCLGSCTQIRCGSCRNRALVMAIDKIAPLAGLARDTSASVLSRSKK